VNLFDLSGKTAIVTGGGKGIGRQMAEGLAEAGANIVVCARQAERCEQAATELEQLGVRALGLGCDVRDPEQIQAVVARTLEGFGAVDILVNNAGTVWGATPEDMPLEGWQKVVDVNLTGVFLFSQAAGRAMIDGSGGAIALTRMPCRAGSLRTWPTSSSTSTETSWSRMSLWAGSAAQATSKAPSSSWPPTPRPMSPAIRSSSTEANRLERRPREAASAPGEAGLQGLLVESEAEDRVDEREPVRARLLGGTCDLGDVRRRR